MAARKHDWTDEQYQFLKDNVKGTPRKELHKMFNEHFDLNITIHQIKAACDRKGYRNGLNGEFRKGFIPWNKGMKGLQAGGRSKETQFKKGRTPVNWKPVGSERVDKDGYVLIKVEEPNVWMHKSRKIWQDAGRELPDGHTLMFSDGDRSNVTLDNLLLVSRGQLAIANKNKLFHKDKSLNESVLKYIDLKIAVSKKKKELKI